MAVCVRRRQLSYLVYLMYMLCHCRSMTAVAGEVTSVMSGRPSSLLGTFRSCRRVLSGKNSCQLGRGGDTNILIPAAARINTD